MGDKLITSVVAVLVAIVGVAIIAVLVSQKADTANVLTSGGQAFSSILRAAVAPVSGNNSFSTFTAPMGGTGLGGF